MIITTAAAVKRHLLLFWYIWIKSVKTVDEWVMLGDTYLTLLTYLFIWWLDLLPHHYKYHRTTALKGVQRPVLEQAYQYNIYMVPLKSDYVWVQLT